MKTRLFVLLEIVIKSFNKYTFDTVSSFIYYPDFQFMNQSSWSVLNKSYLGKVNKK